MFGGDGRFHTRVEGRDFTPTEQRIIQRMLEVVVRRLRRSRGSRLPDEVRVRALGNEHAVREHRHAHRGRGRSPRSTSSWAPAAARSTSACRTRWSSRSATSSTAACRATTWSPDKRWVRLLSQQVQSAEVELCARLLGRPSSPSGRLLELKVGDVIAARRAARPRARKSTAFRCSTAATASATASTRSRIERISLRRSERGRVPPGEAHG